MIGETVSHFRITSELGKGGMGIVYKAYDTSLHVDRALKFLQADALENAHYRSRFLAEARSLAAVQHPNICPIQEVGEEDGRVFIAMSYLEGQTLQERLRSGPLSIAAALQIAHEVASGLGKAHSQGVIHRDIKPGNVMLTTDGPAVIMDFGLAKQTDATAMTRTGTVMGTVAYMSPEQARGRELDARSDLWSVGVMLYEMLAGRRPFAAENELALIAAISREHPVPISRYRSEVPVELEEIVERLLEKDPARRYTDAGELLAALGAVEVSALEDEATMPMAAGSRRFRLQRWQRRRLARVSAGAVASVALLAVLLYIWPGFLVPTQDISKIAVLPLQERIDDPSEASYAQGITDELIVSLAKVRALSVISRSSAAKALERYETHEEIARHLGVQALIEGTVERLGDRLRMSVQFVRASTGEVLWAESYERPQRSVYALQNEIARSVAMAANTELTEQESEALAASREVNPRVFELYQRARYHAEELSADGQQKSIRFLEAALALDPENAQAYASLADVYLHLGMGFGGGMDADRAYALATGYLDSALALNPDLSMAHAAKAWKAVYYDWDWDEGEAAYARAIELDPSNAMAWREQGYLYGLLLGRIDEAIASCRRAKELDPLIPSQMLDLAAVLSVSGRYEEALAELDAALELNPAFYPARAVRVGVLRESGRYQESLEAMAQMEKDGLLEEGDQALLGMAYALAGQEAKAREILQHLLENPEGGEFARTSMAMLYNSLGDEKTAVDLLVAAYADHENWFPMYIFDRDLVNLYDEPRIRSIIHELRLSWILDWYNDS